MVESDQPNGEDQPDHSDHQPLLCHRCGLMLTPGKGDFAFLPPPKRTYSAMELSATGGWKQLQYRASYVLSRSWGNYTGLFTSDLF